MRVSSTEQLRILAFCDYFAEPMVGGSERVAAEVFGRIGGHDTTSVTVVTGVSGSRNPVAGIKGIAVVASRGFDLSALLGVQVLVAPLLPLVAVRAIRGFRPHVIHASSIHFFGTLVATFVALVARIPLVVTSHLAGVDSLPGPARLATGLYERTVGRFILARAQRVIAVSTAVRDHLVDIGVPLSKIEVIENGVDSQQYQPPLDRASHGCVAITVVGRLMTNKGTMEVADSLRHVTADVRLSFAGTGPLEKALRREAENDDRVVVLGHRADVADILATSDIFVRYSTTEGRSLALLEAMSAGCAVVVSDIAANVSVVDHDRTGLVVPLGDTEALGTAIELLARDGSLRTRLGKAARLETEQFGWDEVAEHTRKVIADVADGS